MVIKKKFRVHDYEQYRVDKVIVFVIFKFTQMLLYYARPFLIWSFDFGEL
jgi:hypothetical protein